MGSLFHTILNSHENKKDAGRPYKLFPGGSAPRSMFLGPILKKPSYIKKHPFLVDIFFCKRKDVSCCRRMSKLMAQASVVVIAGWQNQGSWYFLMVPVRIFKFWFEAKYMYIYIYMIHWGHIQKLIYGGQKLPTRPVLAARTTHIHFWPPEIEFWWPEMHFWWPETHRPISGDHKYTHPYFWPPEIPFWHQKCISGGQPEISGGGG